MQITSKEGVHFIKEYEKFVDKPYDDGAGFQTIGYGHQMSKEELENVTEISHDDALELLRMDLQDAEQAVRTLITVPLSQHQFDALVSFTFNVGGDALERSTLRSLLNKGFYGTVDEQLSRWVHSNGRKMKGLVLRREAEGRIFTDGTYKSIH